MSRNVDLILVGAGPMAISYSQVLREKNIVFDVIGRGEISAKQFEEKTSIRPFIGLQEYLQSNSIPKDAIVATGVDTLAFCTEILISAEIKNILLDKPVALITEQLNSLHQLADTKKARVLIAYNRRSYASTTKARQMIEEDGGLREIYFEFTEWADVVESSNKLAAVKKKWFLANSTHVVDLAFHFAGLPRQWSHFTSGGSDWHPSATRFAGSGVTERDVLFTYNADWESAG